jgi:urea transport system substrate-binding protein
MRRTQGSGELVFSAEEFVPLSAEELVGSLVTSRGSWLLGLRGDRLEVGAVVRFVLPGFGGGASMEATGRFVALDTPHLIEIAQETPWPARIRVALTQRGTGTAVTMRTTVGEECLSWFQPQDTRGNQGEPSVNIGLLVGLSGPAGIMGRSVVNAASMAVEEVNAHGGIQGVPVRLVTADDRSCAATAREQFRRLTVAEGVQTIVAMVPTPSFDALVTAARLEQTLLLHTPLSEGGPQHHHVFRLGERPADQLALSIPALMKESSARSWFLIGNDYSWPRQVGGIARRVIARAGGAVVGEAYVPFGINDVDRVIETIENSGASLILSTLVGFDSVAFERRCYESGLRSEVRTLSMLMDDTIREHIGDDAARGVWVPLDYLSLPGETQDPAQASWTDRFGPLAPPFGSTARSVYDAIHLYAKAACVARSIEPLDVGRTMRLGRLGASRQLERASGSFLPTPIGEAVDGGFQLVAG